MSEISANIVKELREKTGAGMMDCKKALVAADGDMEKAIENLRKAGITKAEKKASRATKEGRIIAVVSGNQAAMVEVLCETDFVAVNEKFNNFIGTIVRNTVKLPGNGDITAAVQTAEKAELTGMIATIGENMQIRRAVKWETAGKIAYYLHMGGRIGVMVDVEGVIEEEVLADLCKHIAAFRPVYIGPDDVPAEAIAKEKEIAAAQVVGKPAQIVDKIVMGKIGKWYSDVCATRQPWIRDDKTCFEKVAPKAVVKRFVRWEITEELE